MVDDTTDNHQGSILGLTDGDILSFIVIWAQEFREILTREEAGIKAEQLVELYCLLARPLPKEQEEGR